jgi:hypothetical protein
MEYKEPAADPACGSRSEPRRISGRTASSAATASRPVAGERVGWISSCLTKYSIAVAAAVTLSSSSRKVKSWLAPAGVDPTRLTVCSEWSSKSGALMAPSSLAALGNERSTYMCVERS